MAPNEQQPPRTKRDRIERLRNRLDRIAREQSTAVDVRLVAVIKGILDLLSDEL